MLNMVPLSELTGIPMTEVKVIACAFCQAIFTSETSKAEHLEEAHPNWAALMMSAYLRQIPRENG
jgi:hypothetical protein